MFRIFKKTNNQPTWFNELDFYQKTYVDCENNYNMILSKNFQLSMNATQTGLNNNVLLISDNLLKIEDFFLSNMLQSNCSYVVIDNRVGSFRERTKNFFNYKCYIMKEFGYLGEDSKFCYNPFAYIETVDDVKVMVDSMFEHIGYGVSDQNFVDTMRLLFHIAALYVFESKEFKNPTLMDIVDVFQEFKTETIKEKMLELENKHLNCKSVHFYKVVRDYKQSEIEQIVDGFNELQMAQMLQKPEVREMLSRDTLNLKGLSTNKQILYIKMAELGFLATTLVAQTVKETKKNNDRKEANRHVQFVLANPYLDGGDDMFINVVDRCFNVKRAAQYSFITKLSNKHGINKALTKIQLFDTIVYLDGVKKESENLLSFLELKCEGLLNKEEILNFHIGKCLIFIKELRPIQDDEYDLQTHPHYKTLGGRCDIFE
jgi:hypothetical protein